MTEPVVLDVRRPLRGRPAPQGAGLRARPRPPQAHAEQQRRAALRRRDVGRERPARPRRLRQQADPARRRGRRAARAARGDAAGRRCPGLAAGPQDRGQPRRARPRGRHPGLPGVPRAEAAGGVPHRWAGHQRPARGLPVRLHQPGPRVHRRPRVPDAAAAQHALHPRHHLLALRRPHHEPALLAGPQGRDADLQGDLPVPPRLRRLDDLVGRPRAGLGPGDVRGRRRHAGRQRRRAGGHERADLAPGDHPGGGGAVRRRARPSA